MDVDLFFKSSDIPVLMPATAPPLKHIVLLSHALYSFSEVRLYGGYLPFSRFRRRFEAFSRQSSS